MKARRYRTGEPLDFEHEISGDAVIITLDLIPPNVYAGAIIEIDSRRGYDLRFYVREVDRATGRVTLCDPRPIFTAATFDSLQERARFARWRI